jgi:hypothetical protein
VGSETQGEKAYKAGDARSRSSSSASDAESPHFTVQTPLIVENSSPSRVSDATNSVTPRTTAGSVGGMTAPQQMLPNFGGVNIADHSTAGQYDRVVLGPSGAASTTSAPSPSFSNSIIHNISQGGPYDLTQATMGPMFPSQDLTGQIYPGSSAGSFLPSLSIPDPPGLYHGSPFHSSDSTWSTPSIPNFPRDRSASVATNPENYQPMAWSPQYTNSTLHTPRSLDAVPESYDSPPYLSPHMSPNTSYPLAGVSSPATRYHQELVGIPTLSSPYKSHTQLSSASQPPRLSKSDMAGVNGGLVDAPYLVSPSGEAGTVLVGERMEEYLIAYKLHLEPVYSIIHLETFASHPSDLVRRAMAALGSQFHIIPGDREKGSQLHESCLGMIQSLSVCIS